MTTFTDAMNARPSATFTGTTVKELQEFFNSHRDFLMSRFEDIFGREFVEKYLTLTELPDLSDEEVAYAAARGNTMVRVTINGHPDPEIAVNVKLKNGTLVMDEMPLVYWPAEAISEGMKRFPSDTVARELEILRPALAKRWDALLSE